MQLSREEIIQALSKHITTKRNIENYIKEKQSEIPFNVPENVLMRLSKAGEQDGIPIGMILNDKIIQNKELHYLKIDDALLQLMVVAGLSGEGKTSLLTPLVINLMARSYKVYIISRKFWEWSSLARLKTFYDLTPNEIKINPFMPPSKDISQKEWNAIISQVLADVGYMFISGSNLHRTLDLYTEENKGLITPEKLIQFIKGKRFYKKLDIDEKIISRLQELTAGDSGKIFNTNEVINFEFYANNSFNFDLHSLKDSQIIYFISIFLTFLLHYKIKSNSKEKHVLFLDDLSEIVHEQKDSPQLKQLLRVINDFGRKLNLFIAIVCQSVNGISSEIIDAAKTIIRFKTGSLSDDKLDRIFKMTKKEQELFDKTPKGFFIAQVKTISYKPILLYTKYFPLPELDKEQRNKIMHAKLDEINKYLTIYAEIEKVKENQEQYIKEDENNKLESDLVKILQDYREFPYESVTEKAKKLNYKPATFVRHLKKLKEQNYLEEIIINLGKGVGIIKLFKFTEKAVNKIGKQNITGRSGSFIQGYFLNLVSKYYELDSQNIVEVEKHIKLDGEDFFIDVAVYGKNQEKKIGIELALTNHKFVHESKNLEKVVKAGFQTVISASTSQEILDGIKHEAISSNLPMEKIQFKILKEYYYELQSRKK